MKESIQAVHADDIEDFFASIGLFQELKEGRLKCHACGATITPDNFTLMTRRNGRLLFLCAAKLCLVELFRTGGKK